MKNQRGITKWNTFSVAVLNTSKAQHHAVVKLNTCEATTESILLLWKKKKKLFQTSFYFNTTLSFTFSRKHFSHYAVMPPLDRTLPQT